MHLRKREVRDSEMPVVCRSYYSDSWEYMIARLFFESYKLTECIILEHSKYIVPFSHALFQFVQRHNAAIKRYMECLVLHITFCVLCCLFQAAASCALGTLPAVAVLVFLIRKQMRTFICLVHLLTWPAPTQTLLPQLATRNAKFSRYCSTPAT